MTKPMDKLLRDALRGSANTPPRTPCLDIDTVAALAEGTLTARERSAAEAHAAECPRCQGVLAAMVRTMPPVAPRVWWRRPAFVWLAPLTAAAAAVVVWSNVPRSTIVAPDAQSAAMRAPEPVPNLAAPASPRAEFEQKSPAAPAAPAAGAASALERNRAAAKRGTPEPVQQNALADRAAVSAVPSAPGAAEDRTAAVQQPSAPAPPTVAAPAPPSPATTAETSAQVAAAAEQAQRAAAGTMAGNSADARQLMARRFVAKETTIVSADSQSRWRLGSVSGFVEHSTDGGATWQVLPTGVNAMLVDGSSPSRSVCWLVGQGGVVILTTDEGRSWQRLTLTASVDLRSVNATSDKNATVVAADGRRFTTSDGGRTWRP